MTSFVVLQGKEAGGIPGRGQEEGEPHGLLRVQDGGDDALLGHQQQRQGPRDRQQ